jgi:hypothetical protein
MKKKTITVQCVKCQKTWQVDDSRGLAVLSLMGKHGFDLDKDGQWTCKSCRLKAARAHQ